MYFRVFYDDREPYTGSYDEPEHTPKRGVQAIIAYDSEHKWYLTYGNDLYIWKELDGMLNWYGCDIFGLWDYLQEPGYKLVLFGRVIGNKEWGELKAKLFETKEMQEKTAWRRSERGR